MVATFRRLHGLANDSLRIDELAQAEAHAQSKFSSAAWIADVSPAARMRGFSSPATTEYDVVGSVHFAGTWPAQSAASVAIVQGVTPSTHRGALSRTAPKSPPSNFASMRSNVSAVSGVALVDAPPPSSNTSPRSFAYPGSGAPTPVRLKSVAA